VLRRTSLTLLVLALAWPAGAVAVAQEPGPQPAPAPADAPPPVVADPRLSPNLAAVAVDSPAYRVALDRFRQAEQRVAEARDRFTSEQELLGELHQAEARLIGDVNEASRRRSKSARRAEELSGAVHDLAVATYVGGGMGLGDGVALGGASTPLAQDLDLEAITAGQRHRVLVEAVSRDQLAEYRAHLDVVEQSDQAIVAGVAAIDEVRRRLVTTAAARDEAQADATRANDDLLRRSSELADARLGAQVVGLDFSLVVLDAYVRAALVLLFEQPSCGLRWQALAGIGRTESGHGTFGGAVVDPSGQVSRPIIGIPLDGNNGTEAIGDTDGGELDGDPVVDRAVGPMQFIPTSWRAFGRDGNGDGRRDPQNLYDSATAAGVLLCRGAPLDSDGRLRASFLRYNNSGAYADTVLGRTRGYDGFVIPPVPGA
jgi:membrane-bound lytic murein transglycosylase B